MLRRRWAIGFSLLLAACSNKADAPATKSAPDIRDVVFVGGTTDEALLRLLDATAKDEAQKYVIVDAPDLSVPLPRSSPAALTFHLASQAALTPLPGVKAALPAPPTWQRPLRELLQLLGPPRVAYAHGIPYNGTAYLLVISDAQAKPLLRVFTGPASYTPAVDVWQTLAGAPQPLTLEITSGFFEENNIPIDGGPFVGGSFQFRIE